MGSCGCSSEGEIHVGDHGMIVVFEVLDADSVDDCESACDAEPIDVSGGVFTVIFTDPDGAATSYTAPDVTLSTDGSDGRFELEVPSGLLNAPGIWRRQGRVVVNGRRWSSAIKCFEVLPNLD